MQRVERNMVWAALDLIEFLCFCDECKKTVPVKAVKITKTGFLMIWLECGHTTGFAFNTKLVPIEKIEKKERGVKP